MRRELTSEQAAKRRKATADIAKLKGFIGEHQLSVVRSALRGEEWEFFADKMAEFVGIIESMPSTGQTDGQGGKAVAHLRYFAGGRASFHITEKDKGSPDDTAEDFQSQAFGLTDLYGTGDGELGYISIAEIIANRGELDFHYTPKTLDAIQGKDKPAEPSLEVLAQYEREQWINKNPCVQCQNDAEINLGKNGDYICGSCGWIMKSPNPEVITTFTKELAREIGLEHEEVGLFDEMKGC